MHDYSNLFRSLDARFQVLQYKLMGGYHYSKQTKQEQNKRKMDQEASVNITRDLLKKMRNTLHPSVSALSFNCDTAEKSHTFIQQWIEIATQAGFDVFPEVSQSVEKLEALGQEVRAKDGGHWSPRGHQEAGEALVKILRESYL